MEKTKKHTRVVLLDTHAILHRAYHALPDFTSPDGTPTGALYGLTAFILKIVDELKPDHIIAAYDLPDPTVRHEAFTEYKATREKTDDALINQLITSREILDAFAIPHLECKGYEADDVLGTLAEVFKKQKDTEVIIASGDMDTLQLVDGDTVQVYTLKKGINDTIVYNEAGVKERYGFGPELVADYKGLRGDPSDNIPGIRGIGEKTATKLITTFGGLDGIYNALTKTPEAFSEIKITPRIMNLLIEGEDDARFSKELATIQCDIPITPPKVEGKWLERIQPQKALGLFSKLGFRTLSNRFKQKIGTDESVEQKEIVTEAVDEKEVQKIGIALWLVRSDITNPNKKDILEYANTESFEHAKKVILKELKEKELLSVYKDIELPLVPLIEEMEEKGILLDTDYLKTLSKQYHNELDTLQKRIYKRAGEEFNINSPKQLGVVLFDTLEIGSGKGKRTATGQRSTREDELKKYINDNPIIKDILEYRELQKLLSTYIDNLPNMTDKKGRLHAQFVQTGTTTGRMSSQAPNMQNLPIKSERGIAIRNAIIAPKGAVLIAADYSQIELRVVAILSGDKKLVRYFKDNLDAHTEVASQVFSVDSSEVTKEMRRKAKVINFGILYGMGVNALAKETGTSRSEAKAYLEAYFKRYEGVASFIEQVKQSVHKKGYTQTWFGRRRYFEGINSQLSYMQAQAERMAVNAPIQGTSADIIKRAMVRVDDALKDANLKKHATLIAQIHDELVYEVDEKKQKEVASLVQKEMESVMTKKETSGVPLKVDVSVGQNWGEMKGV
jgi:DNA polymerase-1